MKYYLAILLFFEVLCIFSSEPADKEHDIKSYCFFGSFTYPNASRECYAVEGRYTWKSCCCDLLGESWGPRCDDCPLVTSDEFTNLCNANAEAHIVINHLLPSILSAPPPVPDIHPEDDCSIDVPGSSSMEINAQAQAAFKICCCEKGLDRVQWKTKHFSCPAYGLDTYHMLCGSPLDVEEIDNGFDSVQSDSSQVVVIAPCYKNISHVKEDYWACSEALAGELSQTDCCCQPNVKAWGDECQPCKQYSDVACNLQQYPNQKHDGGKTFLELPEDEGSGNVLGGQNKVSSSLESSMMSNGFPSIPSDVNSRANKNNYGVDILQVQAECYMSKKVNSSGLYCYEAWHTNMTISECCCLIGQGWGRPCQRCPHTDSKLFSELCMSASGFGAAHRDPSVTKNQFVYPIPPFMSSSDSQSESESLSIKPPPVVLAPETESLSTLVGFDLCYELVYFHNDTTVCGLVMTYLLTYTDCCCGYPGIGRGWGQDCIQCPLPNSNDFEDMCGFSVSFDHSTYISYRPEISIPDYDNSQFGCYGPMLVSNTSSYDSGTHCSNNMLASGASEVECCCLLNGESWGSECSACAPIGTDDFSAFCDDDYREAEKQIPLEVPLYERCYATYNGSNGGHCEGILYIDVTWQQCCCMAYGKAWGGSCFPCPPIGSESYKSICNVPLISIDYDPSDLCRRDSCSPGHCQIVNLNTEICSCPAGYKQSRKGLTCQDADECMLQQGLCEPGACFNTLGSYYCFCPDGFAHFQGEQHCRDLNECASIGDQCHPGYCVNLEGSFECRCPIGFYYNRDQVMCDDLNECSVNVMLCYPGICLNTEGSFKCVCPYNYEYDIRRQLCIPRSKFTSIAIMIPSLPERQYNPDQAENPENQPDKAIGKVSGISKGVTTDGGDCNEMDLMPNLADICSPSVRVNVTLEFIVKHNVTNDNEEQWLRKLMELHFKTEISVGIVDKIDGKPHGFAHPWEVKKFSGFVSEMCTQLHVVHSSFESVVEHVSNNSKTQVYFSLTVIRASFSEYVDEVDLEMNCVISKHNYSETYFIESGHSNFVYISASNILYVPSQVEFQKVHRFSDSGDSCQETSLYVCSNEETLEHCPPLVLNSSISLNMTVSVKTNEGVEPTLTNQSMLHPRGRPEVCRSLKRDTLNYTPTSFFPQNSDHMQVIISCIGILLSLVALTITFIVRCVFRSLRTLLGKILMNLIGALFIGQLGVLLQGQGVAYPILCTTIAAVMHYVWLAAFFWMNAMALDFFFTFGSKVKLRKRHSKRKILQAYMFYGWGAPIPIIILCLVIHFEQFNNLRFRYGNEFSCWIYDEKSTLLAFGLPLMIILLFNILLFICAVIGLRLTKVVNKVGDAKNTRLKRFRTDLLVYVKMSTLMGFTWIFGFVSAFTQLKIFLYTFIVLNSLQGVFIFMAFTCNKHVRKEVKRCLNRGLQNAGRDQRKSSAGKFNSSDVTRQSDEPVKNNVSKLTHL